MEVEGAAEAKEEEGAEAGDEMDADLFQVEEILARRLQPDSAYPYPYLYPYPYPTPAANPKPNPSPEPNPKN